MRKTIILAAAVKIAETEGLMNITREGIAELAECSTGLVNFYFGTMVNLRRAIVGAAIHSENLAIIAQALAAGDKRAQRAPDNLKRKALETLMR
jgi:AcrR family transcriptional regulator